MNREWGYEWGYEWGLKSNSACIYAQLLLEPLLNMHIASYMSVIMYLNMLPYTCDDMELSHIYTKYWCAELLHQFCRMQLYYSAGVYAPEDTPWIALQ